MKWRCSPFSTRAVEADVVAVLQIGDLLGEGADRQGVRAEIHLALAPADHQRAAVAGTEDDPVLALDQHGQGIGPAQPVQHRLEGVQRIASGREALVDQMGHHLGVGLALKHMAGGLQFGLQLGEVLDDAVVHQRHPPGLVRVGVFGVGGAVGGPAGVADADRRDAGGAGQGIGGQHRLQLRDLALGATPGSAAVDHRGDASGVIAAVLQPLEAVDQAGNRRALAGDADDPAHAVCPVVAVTLPRVRITARAEGPCPEPRPRMTMV
jgi:hypothetical protein